LISNMPLPPVLLNLTLFEGVVSRLCGASMPVLHDPFHRMDPVIGRGGRACQPALPLTWN
jgi:hypothetical protein